MGRVGRKKHHKGDKPMKEKYRTKRKTKDIDQIHEDLKPENSAKLLHQPVDFDLPGNAQYYCIECARYFVNQSSLDEHKRSKVHKRRLKCLEDEPYTAEEACKAAGMGSYQPPKKRKLSND